MTGVPELGDWERCRGYLRVLARQGLGSRLRGKVDESDVVQETLLQAFRMREQFQGETTPELLGWLRQILLNKLCDLHRRYRNGKRDVARERMIENTLEASSQWLAARQPAAGASPSEAAALREDALSMAASLEQLPPRQREAVELHYLQGCSYSETAQRMDLSRDQVAGLIRRGLEKLRDGELPDRLKTP